MWQFKDLEYTHLHTFCSEKIGTQMWYKGHMTIEERQVDFTFFFDGEDLYDYYERDVDDYDIKDYEAEMAFCIASSIAQEEDYITAANETIERYNNGAYFPIDLNE